MMGILGVGLIFILSLAGCGAVSNSAPDGPVDDSGAGGDGPAVSDAATVDAGCTEEVLDLRDNDCDGEVDDGFWTTMFTVPHSTLAGRDISCDGQATIEANPYACQLAARRECEARGYPAGFRPVEVTGSLAALVCVADVERVERVSYATLSASFPDCTAAEDAFQTPCIVAIKRYCRERGFQIGIGPLSDDVATSIDFVCTKHARLVQQSFDELAAADPACALPRAGVAWSFACFRAYHRHCVSQGFVSAWGPLEISGPDRYVDIACLPARP